MNQKGPDQIIFDHLYRIGQELSYTPYIANPPHGTPYPYVQMGQVQIVPRATKSFLVGTAYAVMDIWGNQYDRKKVSDLATKIFELSGKYLQTKEGLQISMDQNTSSIEIMIDTSTNDPLWRGRISLTFNFY